MTDRRRVFTLPEVKAVFSSEYSALLGKFTETILTLDKADSDVSGPANSPGIYIFWKEEYGVIKVGKSQANSRVRALQQIRDNSKADGLEMKSLKGDPETYLLLLNILLPQDMHWILGLEYYLEKNLYPYIPQGRVG